MPGWRIFKILLITADFFGQKQRCILEIFCIWDLDPLKALEWRCCFAAFFLWSFTSHGWWECTHVYDVCLWRGITKVPCFSAAEWRRMVSCRVTGIVCVLPKSTVWEITWLHSLVRAVLLIDRYLLHACRPESVNVVGMIGTPCGNIFNVLPACVAHVMPGDKN